MRCTSEEDRALLLGLARQAIEYGLEYRRSMRVATEDYSDQLQRPAATFVTLYRDSQLAGCIGSLEASVALVRSVVENAYAAAFNDPRFAAVTELDLPRLQIEIAILSELEPIQVSNEQALKDSLESGKHGLLLEAPEQRATFLPKVWQSLPDKGAFLEQLKLKAGLRKDYWSDQIKCYLYTTESFSDV